MKPVLKYYFKLKVQYRSHVPQWVLGEEVRNSFSHSLQSAMDRSQGPKHGTWVSCQGQHNIELSKDVLHSEESRKFMYIDACTYLTCHERGSVCLDRRLHNQSYQAERKSKEHNNK